jgi:aarF domain-containing kinase
MKDSAPPRSVWARSSRLVRLAAGLAQKEVRGRIGRATASDALGVAVSRLRVQVEQAKEIVESLGQLKGAAMKAGQLLSMELADVLPPEVIDVLQKLQDSGPAVTWEEIHSILEAELGPDRMKSLTVEQTPLASASIGQVHRAVWTRPDGQRVDVVLKVQFRGIAETIDSDLALLERIARAFVAVQLKNIDLGAVFTELRAVLVRETDYVQEADSVERYRLLAHEVPGLRVPEVYREISTRRVIALSHEHGLKLSAFLATGPTRAERERVAHQLLDLYFREFFSWGLVQTDANFANFLFRPETQELVLLDFGATRAYDEAFRASYRALLLRCFEGDYAATLSEAESLGLIDPRESEASQRALFDLITSVLSVFREHRQPLDFLDKRIVTESGDRLRGYYAGLERSAPPAQLLFLHRKLGGTFSMGKALGARIDLTPFWRRLEQAEVASGPSAARETDARVAEGSA